MPRETAVVRKQGECLGQGFPPVFVFLEWRTWVGVGCVLSLCPLHGLCDMVKKNINTLSWSSGHKLPIPNRELYFISFPCENRENEMEWALLGESQQSQKATKEVGPLHTLCLSSQSCSSVAKLSSRLSHKYLGAINILDSNCYMVTFWFYFLLVFSSPHLHIWTNKSQLT